MTGDTPDKEALNSGDVVKAQGKCTTDPLYRLIGSILLLESRKKDSEESFSGLFNPQTELQDDRTSDHMNQIYNGLIGLKLRPSNDTGPFGMTVQEEEVWMDSRREFLGPQSYTVLARVESKLMNDEKWDLIDALRLLGGIMPSDEIDNMREELIEDAIEEEKVKEGDVEAEYQKLLEEGEIPPDMDTGKVKENIQEALKSPIDLDLLDHNDFILEKGYILNPIAIYW